MSTATRKYPTTPVSLMKHPASLPKRIIPNDVDHQSVTAAGLQRLNNLSINDLTTEALWRDICALTGTLRTFFSAKLLIKVWRELFAKHMPTNFATTPGSSHLTSIGPHGSWVEAMFTFDLEGPRPAKCSGIIGLVPGDGDPTSPSDWKIWLLSTILEQPQGFPDVDQLEPRHGQPKLNGQINGQSNDTQPYDCVVVGGSIAGLCMAARLQALGLSYLLVEKHDTVGDNWYRDRYDSLKLHTSKGYNQMPYEPRTFRKEDPYHLGTADLADGFKRFVETFGINVMTSTALVAGAFDENARCWSLELANSGRKVTVKASHCVLAVGSMGVVPNMPTYPGRDCFQGEVIHGLDWRNADKWKGQGKGGICVGSANTAHGVIADMAKAGFTAVTMIQRSRTWVMPGSTFSALVDPVFNYETPLPLSDRMLLGYPLPVQRLMAKAGIKICADAQPEYFDALEARGWDLERDGDLWGMMYDREGGHFFDLGSAELVANGTVEVKCDALPVAYTETGLEMSDGSHIDADVIVFATGYTGNMKDTARKAFGTGIGDSLEEFWQCDEEGESRGAWKYTGHPRLWYTGHGFAHARYYSRFVAMHIKADLDGHPIEQFTETPAV